MSYGRILTAMVTPMNQSLEVDYAEAKRLAEYLVEHGSDGIVVSGTTGESPTLSFDEKVRLFGVVKEAVGKRAAVIAGVGSNSTDASIELAQKAEEVGVDGLLVVVPYYNKPTQEGLYQHFKAIAESTSLPVMLYNVPGRTSANLLPHTVQRLSRIANITSLKEASGSMDQVSELKRILPQEFAIYSGDDSLTLPMLALGCSGVVSVASHIVGKEMKQMVDAWFAGDYQTALNCHLNLLPMFKGLFVTTSPIPVKYLLGKLGLNPGGLRLPLVNPTLEEQKYLDELLEDTKKL
ncbi:MAG: 4-hydroxy-tetrahydrodipicolinate synthase [Desulfitobacterium hafniense]|nr:4-hydroxy-tetrahydrodipicolinate synthase [Desulfitobacterium hafniense]